MGLNLSELRNAVATHGPLTRILIADHKGSTPREAGTSMLVWANGQSGTIGGGALEQQVTDFARTVDKPTAVNIPLGRMSALSGSTAGYLSHSPIPKHPSGFTVQAT
jgi:xanthine/CO dehydrogenase XdhC/CoxF family maturation factor